MKNLDNKSYIDLIKRTTENNTHASISDDSIKEITAWRVDRNKRFRARIGYFLTFGILYLLSLIWKNIFIKLECVPSVALEADYFLVVDENNKEILISSNFENFNFTNDLLDRYTSKKFAKRDLIQSPYAGKDIQNRREETLILNYKNNKYIYIEDKNTFISVQFELTKFKNLEIQNFFGINFNKTKNKENKLGIKTVLEYNYLLNKFGKNHIQLSKKSFYHIFLGLMMHPYSLYNFFVFILWNVESYFTFAYIIFFCNSLIVFVYSVQMYNNDQRILKLKNNTSVLIHRNLTSENETESKIKEFDYIVPGDLIEISNDELVPCDCLIMSGYCTVNESDLTGESSLVLKTQLPSDNRSFSYDSNKSSILYFGTRIVKCENDSEFSNKNSIIALVISTGYNTNRGNLIQNLLYPKSTNFQFYKDIKLFLSWMTTVYLIFFAVAIYLSKQFNWSTHDLVVKLFDSFTLLVPPSLPICMTFTSFYFNWNLKNKNITCIDPKKMNAAGRSNIIILDKTGTLTEENLEIHGFQRLKVTKFNKEVFGDSNEDSEFKIDTGYSNKIQYDSNFLNNFYNNFSIEFEDIETDTKVMNKVLKNFWSNYNKNEQIYNKTLYQINPINNMIYFIECLSTCHSIDKLKSEILGNTVDKKIFEKFNWVIEHEKVFDYNLGTNYLQYNIKPSNAYKINEYSIFKSYNDLKERSNVNDYHLKVIKRFEFSSKYQSMSVIVKNNLDGSYRFYIKGAPEKIVNMCIASSLPADFETNHLENTKQGIRVLACATKLLPPSDTYHLEIDRTKFENNLTFLGIITFKNQLKRDTKHVISNLMNSDCKLVMSTGDNPYTSLSVARECNMIDINTKRIYLIDTERENSEEVLTISSLLKDDKVPYNIFKQSIMKNLKKNSLLNLSPTKNEQNVKKSNVAIELGKITQNNVNVNLSTFTERTDQKLIHNIQYQNPNVSNFSDYKLNGFPSSNAKFKRSNTKGEFKHKLSEIINNDVICCVSGKAFKFLLDKRKEENQIIRNPFSNKTIDIKVVTNHETMPYSALLKILEDKGRIFYRMAPQDKTDLVTYFKENKNRIVTMCGDGANDCGALMSADVGISVKETKGINITSHFYSSDESISCIEIILKNGRACYENSMIIFKYFILYGLLQLISANMLYCNNRDFTMIQYLFLDIFSLIAVFIACKTNPSYRLIKDSLHNSIFNSRFLLGIIGHLAINLTSVILYINYFVFVYVKDKKSSESLNNQLCEENSVNILFILVCIYF